MKKTTYSVEELGQRLGLKEATAYELIAKGHFEIVYKMSRPNVQKILYKNVQLVCLS